jgi:hypothetical protein
MTSMTGDENNLGSCPVDRGLMRVGDRWSILILRDLDRGLTRYEQLRTSLGIAPNIRSAVTASARRATNICSPKPGATSSPSSPRSARGGASTMARAR